MEGIHAAYYLAFIGDRHGFEKQIVRRLKTHFAAAYSKIQRIALGG
jgi:hypothetical protein